MTVRDWLWIVGTTVPFNLMSRMPVISVPTGFAACGVPTGVQIAGRPLRRSRGRSSASAPG